ncbi:MAG: hypothetical protein GYB65_19520 [Chloroflexi bacterium]|nr:hypothetical protein [Chloroflexota bacterium]
MTRDRRQRMLNNLGWLAVSLFLAMAIWVAANMSNNPLTQEEIDNIAIDVELPDGYVVTRMPGTMTASALVRAPQDDWNLLVSEDIEITADLSDIDEPGEYRIELDGDVKSPLHGTVVSIRPATLTFTVDVETEKRVPVRVIVSEEPPLGYSYPDGLSCQHTEVTVRGSVERVQRIRHVEVRLNLANERNPIVDQLYPLIPITDEGNAVSTTQLTLDPARTLCSVAIQPREDVTLVEVLPAVVSGTLSPGYQFRGYESVSPTSVGLTGDQDAIDDLNRLVRTQSIDLTGRTTTFTVEVPLALPDGVAVVPANQTISVTVNISAQIVTQQIEEVPVEIEGLDQTAYRVVELAPTVDVFVEGPANLIPSRDDLYVYIDLSDVGPGNQQVPTYGEITGMAPDDADAVTITVIPERLSVTIEALQPTPLPEPDVDIGVDVTPTVQPDGEDAIAPEADAPGDRSPDSRNPTSRGPDPLDNPVPADARAAG